MNKDKNSYSFNRNFMYGMMYIRQKIDKNTSKKSIDGYNLKLLNLNMFRRGCFFLHQKWQNCYENIQNI